MKSIDELLRVPWMEASIKEAERKEIPRCCSESLEANGLRVARKVSSLRVIHLKPTNIMHAKSQQQLEIWQNQ